MKKFVMAVLITMAIYAGAYADTLTVSVNRDNGVTNTTEPLTLNAPNIGAAPSVAGVDFFSAADDQHAAIEIDQTIHTSTDDRQGAIHAETTGPDTHTGASANWFEYVATGALTGGFDIASTHIMRADNISGGTAGAQWWVTATPSTNTGPWQVYGGEINILNRYADNGYQEAAGSNAKGTYGLFMVPEGELNVGLGTQRGYNVSGGIVFRRSLGSDYGEARTYPAAKTWTPLWIDQDAIVPGGTGLLARGGSTTGNAPAAAIKIKDYQGIGIDTSTATFSGPAIKLGGGQTISDNAGNSVTVAQLATAVGGGATDSDAIHKSGIAEIDAVTAKAAPVGGDYVLIEDSEAGKVKKKVQLGNLPVPSSVAKLNTDNGLSLNGSDWVTGTGTISTNYAAAVTSGTAGAFANVKAGAAIKLSTGAVHDVLSVTDSSNIVLASNPAIVTNATWSYRNPAVTSQFNGVDYAYIRPRGLELKGDGAGINTTVDVHNWAGAAGFRGSRANGTPAAPTAVTTNDVLLALTAQGWNSGGIWNAAGGVQIKAAEPWTSTAGGSYISFNTTTAGTVVASEKLRINAGGMQTEGLDDKTASFTVANSTSRITLATGTATVTLPKTIPAGTTSVLVTVAGAAASGVSFAAESGGSISWGDAGAPTFTNGKRAKVVCDSQNASATTAAAWDCVKGGNF